MTYEYKIQEPTEDTNRRGRSLLLQLIVFIVVSVCLIWGASIALNNVSTTMCDGTYNREISNISILSLQDNSDISGSFFLGSGYVSQDSVYVFYTGDDINGYEQRHVSTSDSRIYMDTNTTPFMVTKHEYIMETKPLLKACEDRIVNEFHVPKGTIIRNYNLDSKI